jgi:hypothetical protein
MFEQEIELEKKQGGALPLLLMVALIVAFVGVAAYFLIQSRKVLSTPEAANVVIDVLKAQGPTMVSFHTGLVKDNYSESASDPRYRLLQKAGVIKIGKAKGYSTQVDLTPKGRELLQQIPGVKQSKESDSSFAYVVPLATRKLMDVSNVTMAGPERAAIYYSWQWEPNALGENFNAGGSGLAGFNTWDRSSLIDKYGARFYHEPPTKTAIAVVKTPQGWKLATE